jgi:hypothetical protein
MGQPRDLTAAHASLRNSTLAVSTQCGKMTGMDGGDRGISIGDVPTRFRDLLRQAGLSADSLDPDSARRTFRRFADAPVLTASDGILYEFGTFTFGGERRFRVEFVRQFETRDEAGEHDRYVQFRCALEYEPSPDLELLGAHAEWWFRGEAEPLTSWMDRIEQRPEWNVERAHVPVATSLSQADV